MGRPSSQSSHASSSPNSSPRLNSCHGKKLDNHQPLSWHGHVKENAMWHKSKPVSPAVSESSGGFTTVAIVHHPPMEDGTCLQSAEQGSESDCSVPDIVTIPSSPRLPLARYINSTNSYCL